MVSRDVLLMISVSARQTPHRMPASSDLRPAQHCVQLHSTICTACHAMYCHPRNDTFREAGLGHTLVDHRHDVREHALTQLAHQVIDRAARGLRGAPHNFAMLYSVISIPKQLNLAKFTVKTLSGRPHLTLVVALA